MTAEHTPAPAEAERDQAEQFVSQWKALAIRRRERAEEALAERDRYEAAWRSARERAREKAADAAREGAAGRATHQRARKAERTIDRVRQADTLGAALAAVAEHDGMTPQAAAVHAAFTNAADSARARLEEQQRAHEVELAHSERRAASWASTAHRYAASLDAARAEADRFRAAWQSARTRAQVATRRAEHRLGVLERRRTQLRALEDQAREAVEEAAQQRARANGWRGHAIEADARADRHLAAWRSARRRAADRTEERDRALSLAAHLDRDRAQRCPSCEHLLESHTDPAGCWFTVTHGKPDRDAVCGCRNTPAALATTEATA